MKKRPILFNAPMVRAVLDGSKTQTRREIKHVTSTTLGECINDVDGLLSRLDIAPSNWEVCPFGTRGDHLYVRETWQHSNYPMGPLDKDCYIFYRADYFDDPHGMDGEKSPEGKYRDWKPSIHMPRWASRILLEITNVRVERLQDISEADAIAEGCYQDAAVNGMWTADGDTYTSSTDGAKGAYRKLWESINGPGSWDVNPWVWVIEFKVVQP